MGLPNTADQQSGTSQSVVKNHQPKIISHLELCPLEKDNLQNLQVHNKRKKKRKVHQLILTDTSVKNIIEEINKMEQKIIEIV